MKLHINFAPDFELNPDIIKNVKKIINGKCSSTKLFISVDDVTEEEGDDVYEYLQSFGNVKITDRKKYYTLEELLNYDYFYCSGQIKPDTKVDFLDFEVIPVLFYD